MQWLTQVRRRLACLIRRERFDRDLEEEMQSHLARLAQEKQESGMNSGEARLAARRQFGNATVLRESGRNVWAWPLEEFVRDVRFALRGMRRSPGFTTVAIATLALGIGANAAIFTAVDAFLLRPLPFADARRLVFVSQENKAKGIGGVTSFPEYVEWKRSNRSFDALGAYGTGQENLAGVDEPERIAFGRATATLLEMLGAKPMLGRGFLPEEDVPGGRHVALLSETLWHRHFGGRSGVLGKSLQIGSTAYTIVGVLPAAFSLTIQPVDVWIAVGADKPDPNYSFLTVIGRLKPGIALPQAQADMTALNAGMRSSKDGWEVVLYPLRETYAAEARPGLVMLLAAVTMVLLIACANLMNLLLYRAASRRKEMALRTSLGAGRARLARQMLTECATLSLAGGSVGLLLAHWGVRAFSAMTPAHMHPLGGFHIDGTVLGFTGLVSLLAAFVFGMAPALRISRLDLNAELKESGRLAADGGHGRLGRWLVACEVALALVLLIGAVLLIRSFGRVMNIDPGFRTDHLLTLETALPEAKFPKDEQAVDFYHQLVERVGALPGVRAAAVVDTLPIVGIESANGLRLEGLPGQSNHRVAGLRVVSANYFSTMGIPIRKGRGFTADDRGSAASVAIINETMAARFWPGQDAIGKAIRIFRGGSGYKIPSVVIGIVRNTKYFGLEGKEWPEMFVPHAQLAYSSLDLVVRTQVDPAAMASAVRTAVRGLDPETVIADVRTMDAILSDSVAPRRFTVALLATFAGLALVLSVVGLYGVAAYAVAQRRHEIGIRMALGAQRGSVLRLVLGQGLAATLAGVSIGLVGALALTKLLASMLFGITPHDPVTFAVCGLLVAGVALLATGFPARRAAKIDPWEALRHE
jgi:putative ABC transport system permease protein